MAEESPISPINEAVPPKANPLASPATAHAATLKLKPVIRPGVKLPTKPAAGAAALKPGLKLPTQTALKPGLKLPTQTALKPGLKLPTQTALKPGLKLPTQAGARPGLKLPTKPGMKSLIRKPAIGGAPSAVKPAVPVPPVASAATAPAAPAAPVVEPPKPLEQLKAVTQNLKTLTAQIPQQAILRKTGIIASGHGDGQSEAQKQAAKSKTSRISLADAIGVSPVKNEALPMKTIRIKRPEGIPGTTPQATPAETTAGAKPPDDVATSSITKLSPDSATKAPTTSFTQRKTLKITRSGGPVHPIGKFGVKKPTQTSTAKTTPAAAAPAAEGGGVPEIADIPDIPAVPTMSAPTAAPKDTIADVPKTVGVLGIIVQAAACVVIGALAWFLYTDAQLPQF